METLIGFHRQIHGDGVNVSSVAVGVDGVQEAKSSKVSLNIFAIKFSGCRNIYPLTIQRPEPSAGVAKDEAKRYLIELVKQLK